MADRRTLPALKAQVPAPALVVGGPLALAIAFFLLISGMAPHAALLPTISAATNAGHCACSDPGPASASHAFSPNATAEAAASRTPVAIGDGTCIV